MDGTILGGGYLVSVSLISHRLYCFNDIDSLLGSMLAGWIGTDSRGNVGLRLDGYYAGCGM